MSRSRHARVSGAERYERRFHARTRAARRDRANRLTDRVLSALLEA